MDMMQPQEGAPDMKRLAILSTLLLAGTLSLIAAELRNPEQATQPVTLEMVKVKDNLHVITGGGGNTAVFLTQKGVVIVDTKNPGMGPGILEKVKSLTSSPVTMIINTHTHGDHVGSNSAFAMPVEIVAHQVCKTGMEKLPAFQSEEGKRFLPSKTYVDTLSLLSGKDRIDLYHFGRGHTGGDTFVVFRELRTMHAGDMFPSKSTPIIDTNNGGSGVDYARTLAKVASNVRGVDTVIPGHSAVTDWNAFKEFGEFVRDLVAATEQLKKAGKTAEETAAQITLPEKYKAYGMGRLKDDVTKIYNELK